MPLNSQGKLIIYCLNVGQGDTTIIITPKNHLIIIDAIRAKKIENLLKQVGFEEGQKIDHLIVSHPYNDHYSGVNRLIKNMGLRKSHLAHCGVTNKEFLVMWE